MRDLDDVLEALRARFGELDAETAASLSSSLR
jgi:hypothetical protein